MTLTHENSSPHFLINYDASLQKGDEHLDSQTDKLTKLILYLSSNLPGTGATTQRKHLEKSYNLEALSGGQWRRALGEHYKDLALLPNNSNASERSWREFRSIYWPAFQDSPQALLNILEEYITTDTSESTLKLFNDHHLAYGKGKYSAFINMIPDMLLYYKLCQNNEQNGYILEAKWAVLNSLLVNEIRAGLRQTYPLPTIDRTAFSEARLLLKGKPSVSAERVAIREIKNGSLKLPGRVTIEEFLTWINSGKNSFPGSIRPSTLESWWDTKVEYYKAANDQRMISDSKQMTMTYKLDNQMIHPAHLEKLSPKPLGVVDATQGEQEVLRDLLIEVGKQVPGYGQVAQTR